MKERDNFELDLIKLFVALFRRLPVVLIISVFVAAASFFMLRTPVEKIYVGKTSFLAKDYSQLSTQITETYCTTSASPAACEAVITQEGLPYSVEELAKMVSSSQDSVAYSFSVYIRSSDKDEALRLAQAFSRVLPGLYSQIAPSGMIPALLDPGSVSEETSGGVPVKKVLVFAFAAFLLSTCFFAFLYLINEYSGKSRVMSSDIKKLYPKVKILSVISSKQKCEALKKLRTNLRLSLPENAACQIIGLTSAAPGTDKDNLALDLAASFAETGDRVLLIDADLRSHSLSDSVKAGANQGLSELIRKTELVNSAVSVLDINGASISFISAGNGASEASELLDDRKFLPVLQNLQANYDLIIIDLEALSSSIDAAAVGKKLDGVLIALRDENCFCNQLTECMSQLEFAKATVLGFAEFKK